MIYAKINNNVVVEYPLTETQIKQLFPNTSWPEEFKPPVDFVVVKQVNPPTVDYLKNVVEITPELLNGVWTQTWKIENASSAEIQERTSAKAAEVRKQRNEDLANSDWTQLQDSPANPVEWAVYRQELRDITTQSGFPWNVVWPIPPA